MATVEQSRYLQYLPAIFEETQPGVGRALDLGQFLLPFQAAFDEFDEVLATIDRYFAPELAPDTDFLPWLATWVALAVDEEWEMDKRRRLISQAVELYRWRGTVLGLKRYIALYTGLDESAIEIQEARWPGGMQIGVASRIGGMVVKQESASTKGANAINAAQHDYYVIDTVTPTDLPDGVPLPVDAGQPLQLYYCADPDEKTGSVERIQLEEAGVHVAYRKPNNAGLVTLFHKRPGGADPDAKPNISRRTDLIDYAYTHIARSNGEAKTINYRGGTFLIEQAKLPYRFIVNIHWPANSAPQSQTELDKRLTKVRAILDLEKPAHTEYYLKYTPTMIETVAQWMQIEVRSSIGLDTAIG